jgi:hypothetical protein
MLTYIISLFPFGVTLPLVLTSGLADGTVTFHEAVHSLRPDASAYPISECPMWVTRRADIRIRYALTFAHVIAANRYLAQVNNQKLTNAPEVFVDRQGRFFPVAYSVAPLHGGYEHGAVIVSRGSPTMALLTPPDRI